MICGFENNLLSKSQDKITKNYCKTSKNALYSNSLMNKTVPAQVAE